MSQARGGLTCEHIPDFDHAVLQASGQQQALSPPGWRSDRTGPWGGFGRPGSEGQTPDGVAAAEAFVS